MSEQSPSGDRDKPADRVTDASEEFLTGARWLAADLGRCLVAAAVIAFGFLVIAGIGGWPWSGIAVAFVFVATAVAAILLRSQLWIAVVIGVFMLLTLIPRWLAPDPALTGGPFPLADDIPSNWMVGAMAAGVAAWLAATIFERVQAARRVIGRWRKGR
jgi:hypothetical protein